MFAHSIVFDALDRAATLAALPEAPAVFALRGADRPDGTPSEPYLGKTPNLRHRLRRLLAPSLAHPRRLELSRVVRSIEYSLAGSAFESDLLLHDAAATAGGHAQARLRLRAPVLLRLSMARAFPRLYLTHKLARASDGSTFGPFPSRAVAERYAEAVLDLFQLRRCFDVLAPHPDHPACVYAEMKKCLAPCNQSCTEQRYGEEAQSVFAFLRTRGGSLLTELDAKRAAASEALDFEQAAALHQRFTKAESVAAQASEGARLLSELEAIIIQPSSEPYTVSLFLLRQNLLRGPVAYSTLGMRLHNEHSGSSSLFSHPASLAPVPLEGSAAAAAETLEERLVRALGSLELTPARAGAADAHLALFARWFYRPRAHRVGEAIFADAHHALRPQAMLRAISRVARDTAAIPEAKAVLEKG